MMKKKSLGLNTIIYTIKIGSSMLFSLVTTPYISRVLLASGVGEYNFSHSFISYFLLIAGLGTSTYAIREAGKIRDDKEKIQLFAQDIFSINFLASFVALSILLVLVAILPALNPYRKIVLILAVSIPLNMLGTEWIFNVYEDFTYITKRSIILQCVSLILMVVFVRKNTDVWKYAVITVVASSGTSLLNYNRAKRYFNHKLNFGTGLKKHLKPILILFISAIASQVYINSDITMMGLIKGAYDTGIYSSAARLYDMVRNVMTAVIVIILPRLSYLNTPNTKIEYEKLLNKSLNVYILFLAPVAFGLFCVAPNVVKIFLGSGYLESTGVLRILSFALVFSLLGSFIANTILIVHSEEKRILLATCIGATFNILANLYFIDKYSYIGAAITTLCSEFIVFIVQGIFAFRCVKPFGISKNLFKIMVGLIGMGFTYEFIKGLGYNEFVELIAIIVACAICYMGIMAVLRQDTVNEYVEKFVKTDIR